jgi:hypothetical protein
MSLSLTQVFNPRPGWYRGDFHCHTLHSDGALTPPQLLELARTEGLDFFAITDHNSVSAYPHFGETGNLLILPGTEVTYKGGHFNVFGLEADYDWLTQMDYIPAPRPEDPYPTVNRLMERIAGLGLLNSINHPLLKPWAWEFPDTDLRFVDCLEIWNDPSWPDNQRDNPRAIALWTEWLNAGYGITGIGGSDYHRPVPPPNPPKPPDRLGLPSTYVYASQLSGQAILQAVRQRRAYVSMGPRVTFQARANGQTFDMGADLGQWKGEIEFSATVAGCATPANARIVKNGEAIAESAVANGGVRLTRTDRADATQPAWYRFDVYDAAGLMLAITNPIFVGPRRTPERHWFGDFVSG